MSYRSTHRYPLVMTNVATQPQWNESTRKLAPDDAQRLLEALVSELGIAGCEAALDRQGFESIAYRYLLEPLHAEAQRRRQAAEAWHASQAETAS